VQTGQSMAGRNVRGITNGRFAASREAEADRMCLAPQWMMEVRGRVMLPESVRVVPRTITRVLPAREIRRCVARVLRAAEVAMPVRARGRAMLVRHRAVVLLGMNISAVVIMPADQDGAVSRQA